MATDYEQKYKGALERAKKFKDKYGGDYAGYIFPELAESEDERIRKGLVKLLTVASEAYVVNSTGIKKDSYLTYLEKQKEQKPVPLLPPFDDLIPEDKMNHPLYLEGFDIGREVQKVFDEQKPAEWSDTKELVFKDICNHLEVEGYSGWVVLLNALRNGEFQPKQEWSEEDERIRKWLCDYFSSIDGAWIHKDITCIDILRWLEKQKEQKQEKFPPYVTGFKGDPDPAGTSDLEEAAKEYASKTLCDPDDGPSTGLAKEAFIAGAEWQKEQKPVEWSEEDEKDMAHIIRILDDCYVYGTHDLSKTDLENLVNKLKSLRPQYHGDVTMTEAYKMGLEAGKASSWKPSEEQMNALYDILHPADTVNRLALESLYEQLKAL